MCEVRIGAKVGVVWARTPLIGLLRGAPKRKTLQSSSALNRALTRVDPR